MRTTLSDRADHEQRPRVPHVICSAAAVPFCLNVNIGDVGHSMMLAPVGASHASQPGRLDTLQWFEYASLRIWILGEAGRSSSAR